MRQKLQGKVLIVDDEEALTWTMMRALLKQANGYEVMVANSGQEALEILERNPIDVVVSDVRMPDIDGLQLLSEIKKRYPQTKVILMTAYGSPEMRKEASRRGSIFYIEKPFEIDRLNELIRRALAKEGRGFAGEILNLQLVDILQMGCLGKFTMALVVTQGDQEGIIYIDNGEIVHAEVDGMEGEEAFFTILDWEEGRFVSHSGVLPPKKTITMPWERLLLEGVRRKDEELQRAKEEIRIKGAPPHQEEPREGNITEVVKAKVRELKGLRGYDGVIWTDDRGEEVIVDAADEEGMDIRLSPFLCIVGEWISDSLEAPLLRVHLSSWGGEGGVILRFRPYSLMIKLKGVAADEFLRWGGRVVEGLFTKLKELKKEG